MPIYTSKYYFKMIKMMSASALVASLYSDDHPVQRAFIVVGLLNLIGLRQTLVAVDVHELRRSLHIVRAITSS